jgi:hypothetical protein
MIAGSRRGMLPVDSSRDHRSYSILNGRADAASHRDEVRQPVDRARPVENAQNAFPTRSLENRTERGFPHAPQASSLTLMKRKEQGRKMMRLATY